MIFFIVSFISDTLHKRSSVGVFTNNGSELFHANMKLKTGEYNDYDD